jgi:hypothetical protein
MYNDNSKQLIQALEDTLQLLQNIIETRLTKTRHQNNVLLPRVIRLADKLQLKNKELIGLLFVVICHTGTELPNLESNAFGSSSTSAMAKFCEMTSKELLDFIGERDFLVLIQKRLIDYTLNKD